MGRPRAGTHETATPERLLAAAEAEFARTGLDGTRLEDKGLKLAAGTTVVAQVGKRKFAKIRIA